MNPTVLATVAALGALGAGLWGTRGEARRWWQAAVAWLVCVVALGVWWTADPAGHVGGPVQAVAYDAAGAPVTTVLEVGREGATRQTRSAQLRRPVPQGEAALWGLLALGLLGGVLVLQGRPGLGSGLAALGAVGALVIFVSAGGGGSGEAGMRAFLASFEPAPVRGFTVPEGSWSFRAPGLLALGAAAVAALMGVAARFVPPRPAALTTGLGLAALAAASSVAWQAAAVGGLPWRPVEGALWASAILLAGAFQARDHALHSATAVALAVALGGLALPLAG